MNIIEIISNELNVKQNQVSNAITLIDEQNTIPFISRYRKEVTGGLNDEQLRIIDERLKYLRNLEDRKETIISSIEEQGLLNDELLLLINETTTLATLEDIYRPYKPKRRTRATIAKEKGLLPLSELILNKDTSISPLILAKDFVNEENEVNSVEDAISFALDIIAEKISDDASVREFIKKEILKNGLLESVAKNEELFSVYDTYYNYAEKISTIPSHRILAINRGEKEKFLTVKINVDTDKIFKFIEKKFNVVENHICASFIKEAILDSYKRLLFPSIETEIRGMLKEKAEESAINVFGENLNSLLMQPPISNKTILGWDPAFRTGCKLSIVDKTGKVLDTAVIYPTAPQNKVKESKEILLSLINKYNVDIISLGNGTASRESEKIIADFIKENNLSVKYIIVNEAGASVYSASKLATEEFPNFDVGQRSATSMARRLQDPLAELVKIEPRSIGVGQYQHDMNQTRLNEKLGFVVETCVNKVGVDLNTASSTLLSYISGINKSIAKNIVIYRDENGIFKTRKDLLNVPKLGKKAFEQSAGFLRIRNGKEVLDITGVHPESYGVTKKLLSLLNLKEEDILIGNTKNLRNLIKEKYSLSSLCEILETDEYTLNDIIKELEKPGLDIRETLPAPILKSDILSFDDLSVGMILKGTVRNVIDFGAFVDIGIHQDGLIHISNISNKFVKHPLDILSIGDIVEVKIIELNKEKNKIGLSMKF